MAKAAFPDGWRVENGVIGTDIDFVSTQSVSGGYSILFPNGGSSSVRLVGDWIQIDDRTAGGTTTADNFWEVYVVAYGSATASHQIRLRVETCNAARSTINTSTIYSGISSGASWNTYGTSRFSPTAGDVWARLVIDRPSSTAFDLYIDKAYLNPSPAGARLDWRQAASPVTGSFTSSWANVDLSGGTYNDSTHADATSSTVYIYKPGLYHVHGQVLIDSNLADGDILGIRIDARTPNSAGSGTLQSYIYGTSLTVPAAHVAVSGKELALGVSGLVYMDGRQGSAPAYNSTIRLQVIQHAGTGATYTEASLRAARIAGE